MVPDPPHDSEEQLLPTAASDVPALLAAALAEFCADVDVVERGYVCAAMVNRSGREAERQLQFCVKLHAAVDGLEDVDETLVKLAGRLAELQPHALSEIGLGILTDDAVPAWESKALRIYPT